MDGQPASALRVLAVFPVATRVAAEENDLLRLEPDKLLDLLDDKP